MVVAASRAPLGEENMRKGPHRVDVEPTPRRVRVVFNGQTIADSNNLQGDERIRIIELQFGIAGQPCGPQP